MIAAERQRQIDTEGWTAEHDDAHEGEELLRAADCYIVAASVPGFLNSAGLKANEKFFERMLNTPPDGWPWGPESWKPSEDPMRNLVKAGALIAAEIDRLQRRDGQTAWADAVGAG